MGKINASKVDEWLEEDKLLLIECWSRDGFTNEQIANKMGIPLSTLKRWKSNFQEIADALSKGKEVVDYLVENALLKSALGYTTKKTVTYIGHPDKDGNRKTRRETTIEEVGPNVTACMCWLNNRKPEQWKRNRDNVITNEDKDNNITINIIKKGKEDENNEDWEVYKESGVKTKPSKKHTAISTEDLELTDEEKEWLNE